MIRTARVALGFGLVYLLALVSTDPVDLAMGAILGGTLSWLLGRRLALGPGGHVPSLAQRAVWFPVFAGVVLVDVVQSTLDVALRVVHVRRVERPGIVRIPIGERSERGVAVSALASTLSPGSVLIDVDWDRRDLLVHVIDASDADAVRDHHQRMYERYQRRVFP